jgi:hypothetical protein
MPCPLEINGGFSVRSRYLRTSVRHSVPALTPPGDIDRGTIRAFFAGSDP